MRKCRKAFMAGRICEDAGDRRRPPGEGQGGAPDPAGAALGGAPMSPGLGGVPRPGCGRRQAVSGPPSGGSKPSRSAPAAAPRRASSAAALSRTAAVSGGGAPSRISGLYGETRAAALPRAAQQPFSVLSPDCGLFHLFTLHTLFDPILFPFAVFHRRATSADDGISARY